MTRFKRLTYTCKLMLMGGCCINLSKASNSKTGIQNIYLFLCRLVLKCSSLTATFAKYRLYRWRKRITRIIIKNKCMFIIYKFTSKDKLLAMQAVVLTHPGKIFIHGQRLLLAFWLLKLLINGVVT